MEPPREPRLPGRAELALGRSASAPAFSFGSGRRPVSAGGSRPPQRARGPLGPAAGGLATGVCRRSLRHRLVGLHTSHHAGAAGPERRPPLVPARYPMPIGAPPNAAYGASVLQGAHPPPLTRFYNSYVATDIRGYPEHIPNGQSGKRGRSMRARRSATPR